jgi:4-hydroxythreonine-4-phosphate dehydrogenase
MGDPSGVGPEVTLKAMASLEHSKLADFFIIGDRSVLDRVNKRLNKKIRVPVIDLANVRPVDFSYGASKPAFGAASMAYIDKALEMLASGEADALVTGPINKGSISSAGFPGFQGHTEYLAAKTSTKDFAMMFVGDRLKITLVTRHIALKDVPSSLTPEAIYRTIILTHQALVNKFGIKHPKIAVAGLNPHAGEGGMFGDEEKRIISPAIKKAAKKIKGVSGPFPPDAVFHSVFNRRYDAVVSLYHDQALIPFKMLYFSTGVNMTLGLPFVRTSPDHGTAFDIAGKMIADPSSMKEACLLAARLASKKKSS